MRSGRDRWLFALVITVTLAGALYLAGRGGAVAEDTGPDCRGCVDEESARLADLDAGLAVVRRHETRLRIVADLAAGRLTLLEAAACFRALNAQVPAIETHYLSPEGSEGERVCRQVIRFVRLEPPEAWGSTGLADRLEAELEGRLRDGTLRLPPREATP